MKHFFSALSATLLLAVLAPASARAEAPPTGGTMGIYLENDLFAGTDRYYTSGVKLSWTSPDLSRLSGTPHARMMLPLFDLIPGIHDTNYQKNVIHSIGQDIYTPDNTETFTPVSYTHLDVYKRQVVGGFCAAATGAGADPAGAAGFVSMAGGAEPATGVSGACAGGLCAGG